MEQVITENPYFEAIDKVKLALNTCKKQGNGNCMATVATIGHGGRPSIHLVEIATIIDQGIVFLIYEGSEPHRNMARVPQLALAIEQPESHLNIVVEGKTRPVTEEEAEVIWFRRSGDIQNKLRPKDNQALILSPERIVFRSKHNSHGTEVDVYDLQADGKWFVEGADAGQLAHSLAL